MLLQSKSPVDRSIESLNDVARIPSPSLSNETSTNKLSLFERCFREGGELFDSKTSFENNCLSVRNLERLLLNSGDLSINIGPPAALPKPLFKTAASESRSRNSER